MYMVGYSGTTCVAIDRPPHTYNQSTGAICVCMWCVYSGPRPRLVVTSRSSRESGLLAAISRRRGLYPGIPLLVPLVRHHKTDDTADVHIVRGVRVISEYDTVTRERRRRSVSTRSFGIVAVAFV